MVIGKRRAVLYCQKIEILSLSLLLFILPFEGVTTIKEIFFFSLLGAFVVKSILDFKNIPLKLSLPNRTLNILIIISFLWSAIALLNAIDPLYSLQEIMNKMTKQYMLYFLTFLIVSEISFDKVKRLFYPLVLSTLIMSVYACYQFYQSPVFLENRVSGFTGAFYRLSIFLVLTIPVITALAFTFHGWLRRILLMIVLISSVALFFTFTRAAWIAVVVEASMLITIFLKKYRKFLLLLIVAMFLAIIGLSYKSIISNQLVVHGSEKPRIEALELSIELIRKNPVTGIGYGKGTFSKYYPDVYAKHAHNIFLNTAIELGITGLIIFMAILAIIIRHFTSAIRKESLFEKKLLIAGIFASLVGFISLNLFDYMYHGWPGQMFWILIGFGFAIIRYFNNSANGQSKSVSNRPNIP